MHGIYPDAWKSAIVMPIFKGGDQTNVGNYRPISILPTVAKVAVKWFAKQLSTYLKKKHNMAPLCLVAFQVAPLRLCFYLLFYIF